jgi:hypothetical protein
MNVVRIRNAGNMESILYKTHLITITIYASLTTSCQSCVPNTLMPLANTCLPQMDAVWTALSVVQQTVVKEYWTYVQLPKINPSIMKICFGRTRPGNLRTIMKHVSEAAVFIAFCIGFIFVCACARSVYRRHCIRTSHNIGVPHPTPVPFAVVVHTGQPSGIPAAVIVQ